MILKKKKTSIQEARKLENMAAKVERQEALLAYVAIMADVDLPEESGVTEDE